MVSAVWRAVFLFWRFILNPAEIQCPCHRFQQFNRSDTAAILILLCALFMCAPPAVAQVRRRVRLLAEVIRMLMGSASS
jgi:hypothetical protein